MTNLENIKNILCETIKSMTTEELFEFLSEYDEDEAYFPKEALFPCKKCREIYGICDADIVGTVNYKMCVQRFCEYCQKDFVKQTKI